MEFINGVSFTGIMKGHCCSEKALESLRIMKEETGCNSVILVIGALQDTAQSEYVDYKHEHMPTDEELKKLIVYANEIGLRVILKPFLNCRNGTWRAHINFFDIDVVCEPKWSNWFASYTEYMVHYAKIAEQTGCEMLVIGCEMVQAQRRDREWREVVAEVKKVYRGLITYNTDKYQEEHVTWWDAVDVISSSGYYPINDWEAQLDRIEKVVKKEGKPFFFAENGCMSVTDSSFIPNDWNQKGEINVEEQARWYEAMFEACEKRPFVEGYGLWDWSTRLYKKAEGKNKGGYAIYGKPACDVVKKHFIK